jgi:hypothetical protein
MIFGGLSLVILHGGIKFTSQHGTMLLPAEMEKRTKQHENINQHQPTKMWV